MVWRADAGRSLCQRWVGTELSSALSMKVRRDELTFEERADALMQWRVLLAEASVAVRVPEEAWTLAASYCNRHELKLRAADALHLAVASLRGDAGAMDVTMTDAAVALGVPIERALV